jgi:hypothetical protein
VLRLQEKRILASYIDVVDAALPLRKYDEYSGTTFSDYLRTLITGPSAMKRTIFVSIASYRDPLLWITVKDCANNAERPDLLRFDIVGQNDIDAGDDLARLSFAQQIRYGNIKPRDSRGACWARPIAFGLCDNEDYLLQKVDSCLTRSGTYMHALLYRDPYALQAGCWLLRAAQGSADAGCPGKDIG